MAKLTSLDAERVEGNSQTFASTRLSAAQEYGMSSRRLANPSPVELNDEYTECGDALLSRLGGKEPRWVLPPFLQARTLEQT